MERFSSTKLVELFPRCLVLGFVAYLSFGNDTLMILGVYYSNTVLLLVWYRGKVSQDCDVVQDPLCLKLRLAGIVQASVVMEIA